MWTSSMMMVSGGLTIGQSWGGGNYIGDILDDGTLYHLVLASKASGQNSSRQWKTANTATSGTDSLTNGLANSNAMNVSDHPAAYFCRGLAIAGLTDWYLPAKDELNVVYTNRSSIIGTDAIDIDATFYWSSTQRADALSNAWVQRFDIGSQPSNTKNVGCRVRAIRRVAA